ncbi:MAG: phenylalanine--tRNA ligase subunit beta, partial [Firmicutes bacterium]|nr:phenylalanine--tRNA ligase subunit beta [Bacillota bacterium]
MNLPISWLKEYVDIDCTTQEFMDEITLSGSKVESLTVLGKDIDGIITGKVLEIEKHPDADKLVVTKIDVGNGEPLQIVTGASNLTVGDIVPVAMVNSSVYHGSELVKIK